MSAVSDAKRRLRDWARLPGGYYGRQEDIAAVLDDHDRLEGQVRDLVAGFTRQSLAMAAVEGLCVEADREIPFDEPSVVDADAVREALAKAKPEATR